MAAHLYAPEPPADPDPVPAVEVRVMLQEWWPAAAEMGWPAGSSRVDDDYGWQFTAGRTQYVCTCPAARVLEGLIESCGDERRYRLVGAAAGTLGRSQQHIVARRAEHGPRSAPLSDDRREGTPMGYTHTYRGACGQVADALYDRIEADPLLAPLFGAADAGRLRRHMAQTLLIVLAAADRRAGLAVETSELRQAALTLQVGPDGTGLAERLTEWHRRVPVTARRFGLVAGHLDAALAEAGMPEEHRNELLSVVAAFEPNVVNTADDVITERGPE
jgi:truncated hemoglobin YjbI